MMETKRKLGRIKKNAAGMTKKTKQRKRRTKKVSYKHKYHLWLGSKLAVSCSSTIFASVLVGGFDDLDLEDGDNAKKAN